MDIYENIIVGNFLFGLGVKMGIGHSIAPVEPTSINLLQQTPLDETFGDVLVANARIFRLIEFKRNASSDKKERAKLKLISDALKTEKMPELYAISRKIHWYVHSDFRKSRTQIEVVPYLDFLTPAKRIVLTDFIDVTAKDAVSGEVGERELHFCKRYVELISMCHGLGESGCLLIVITGQGELQYFAADDIRDLIMTPQRMIERYHDRQLAMVNQRAIERVPVLERSHARSQSRGPFLGR